MPERSLSFPKTKRLTLPVEFTRVKHQGKTERGRLFLLGVLAHEDQEEFRVGFVTSKRIGGAVVGSADIMLFPDLLSANLTVKATMYTADCVFGGVLCGASVPVVFMSRADSTQTRLNSLALTLALLDNGFS